MKKLISLILCAALIFTLASCSGNENTEKETTTANDVNISETQNNEAEETTEKEEEINKTITRGTIEGDVYTNEFADFTFTKPSTWIYLTDDEISEQINAGQDAMDLNSIEKALTEKSSLYDMASMDSLGNNVMICYENTMISGFKKFTAEEYIELLDSSLKNISGFTYTFEKTEDIKIGDNEFKKASYTVNYQGAEMTQAYYVKVIDKYVVTIIATAVTIDIADIEAMIG